MRIPIDENKALLMTKKRIGQLKPTYQSYVLNTIDALLYAQECEKEKDKTVLQN